MRAVNNYGIGEPDIAGCYDGDSTFNDLIAIMAGSIAANDYVSIDENLAAGRRLHRPNCLSNVGLVDASSESFAAASSFFVIIIVTTCVPAHKMIGVNIVSLVFFATTAGFYSEIPCSIILILQKTANCTIIGYANFADAALDEKFKLKGSVRIPKTFGRSLVNRLEPELGFRAVSEAIDLGLNRSFVGYSTVRLVKVNPTFEKTHPGYVFIITAYVTS
jgi:hypothetical protein